MATRFPTWVTLCCWGLILLGGCASARQPTGLSSVDLQPGRYLSQYYRSPDLAALASSYQLEPFTVEQARGLSTATAATVFNDELARALAANGLRMNPEAPQLVVSGQVTRFAVASPAWRFLSGRGQAELHVVGEIRRGQEIVFAFADDVTISPFVNPRRQPPLEPDLIARQAARRFAVNLMNELLLPPGPAIPVSGPGDAPPGVDLPAPDQSPPPSPSAAGPAAAEGEDQDSKN